MNPYLDVILRASAVYIFIIVALRLFGKKELAQLSMIDLVFILLISNAVQNAMVGADTSLLGGIVAAGTLFIVNFILKKVTHRFESVSKLIEGEPIMLIYKGEVQLENLKKADISMQELETAVREHGLNSITKVDLAMLETDGNISVLSDDFQQKTVNNRKQSKNIHKSVNDSTQNS